LPRVLGNIDDLEVKANTGRFGPYVQVGKTFVSIPKGEDPISISLERALELYSEKQTAAANNLIKSFDEQEDVQLLNGRYGAYLKIGKNNFKLPKDKKPEELTLAECLEIAEKQGTKKTTKRK
jgi:DNA topoisomerase-1